MVAVWNETEGDREKLIERVKKSMRIFDEGLERARIEGELINALEKDSIRS